MVGIEAALSELKLNILSARFFSTHEYVDGVTASKQWMCVKCEAGSNNRLEIYAANKWVAIIRMTEFTLACTGIENYCALNDAAE